MTAAALARPTAGATAGQRAAALYREARALAEANVSAFAANLEALIAQAAEIADGGDLYPPEVRELCAKLRDQNASRAQALFPGSGHQADAARNAAPRAPTAASPHLEAPAAFPARVLEPSALNPAEVIAAARHAGLGRPGRLPDDL
jgi:predicted NBD/HSP70 family sugar kinase